MLSSTSNSNSRLPNKEWLKIWAGAILLFLAVILFFECTYRYKGYQPSVKDNPSLWALNRSIVKDHDKSEIVLIGSSRTECNIQLDEFEFVYGKKPVQLAIVASSPVPVLKHFAEEKNFIGTIICEVSPDTFFSNRRTHSPEHHIKAYKSFKHSPFASLDKKFVLLLQNNITSMSSQLQMEDFLVAVVTQKWPPSTNIIRPDRNRQYHNDLTRKRKPDLDIPETVGKYTAIRPEAEKIIINVESYVKRIRENGGDVVFVYYNCRGYTKLFELNSCPDHLCWDALIERTSAFSIHSARHPELAEFIPDHDHSHLDYKRAKVFTKRFAKIFKELMKNK